jgi:thiamine-phosphate pyrophosphorylase
MEINQLNMIRSGIYWVIDPATNRHKLAAALRAALSDTVAAVQIWDNFENIENPIEWAGEIVAICHQHQVPVLINNRWEFLLTLALDGVHFDEIPDNYSAIKDQIGRPFMSGLTVTNELQKLQWAEVNQLDYISFCSVFPSATSNSCEPVKLDSIRAARNLFTGKVFLAGGIRPDNLEQLASIDFDGIAMVSGIMQAANPAAAIQEYAKAFQKHHS